MTNPDRQPKKKELPKTPVLGRVIDSGDNWTEFRRELPSGQVTQSSIVFRQDGGVTVFVTAKPRPF